MSSANQIKLLSKAVELDLSHLNPIRKRNFNLMLNYADITVSTPRKMKTIDLSDKLRCELPKGDDFKSSPITGSSAQRMFNRSYVVVWTQKVYPKSLDPELKHEKLRRLLKERREREEQNMKKIMSDPILRERYETLKFKRNDKICVLGTLKNHMTTKLAKTEKLPGCIKVKNIHDDDVSLSCSEEDTEFDLDFGLDD